jgi:hypothetical protein
VHVVDEDTIYDMRRWNDLVNMVWLYMSEEETGERSYTRRYLMLYEHGVLVGFVSGAWLCLVELNIIQAGYA